MINKITSIIKNNKVPITAIIAFVVFVAFWLIVFNINNGIEVKPGKEIEGIKVGDNKVINLFAGSCEKIYEEITSTEIVDVSEQYDVSPYSPYEKERTEQELIEASTPKIYQKCSFLRDTNVIQIGLPKKVRNVIHKKKLIKREEPYVPKYYNPQGPTAQCNDGSYSYSATPRGTCSHHGGVAIWF